MSVKSTKDDQQPSLHPDEAPMADHDAAMTADDGHTATGTTRSPKPPKVSSRESSPAEEIPRVNETPPAAASTFSVFGKLPAELRFSIWEPGAKADRVVCFEREVTTQTIPRRRNPTRTREIQDEHFLSSTKAPAILHVCSESRKVGEKIFASIQTDQTSYLKSTPIPSEISCTS
ncbi:hypothetical protein DL98DRAFT_594298 [Cadophora sp. DSE1049]|nr:hypothetical protein DL98DRAFT_594298 [Cadophora sp. DSE1049]